MDSNYFSSKHFFAPVLVLVIALAALSGSVAYGQTATSMPHPSKSSKNTGPAPTVADAERFITQAEARLLDLWIKDSRASWVAENFITDDTEAIAANADAAVKAATADPARQSTRYEKLSLPPEVARKFKFLKLSVDIPAPRDPGAQEELAKIAVSLNSDYGKGTWCPDDNKSGDAQKNCLELPDIEKILATSSDPQELLNAWKGWHAIAPPMRKRYVRLVELANQGAREMGFADTGAMWRSNYDMLSDDFAKEMDRLWEQVRPLYVSLHAYV
jgi:peptidyl-dipeptidase A